MKLAVASTLLASAAAFAPASVSKSSTALNNAAMDDLKALAEKSNPVLKYYDPLELASTTIYDETNEATIGFLRHAEIKHGRVAMFAFVGYIAHANGLKFPWAMQLDGSPFPSNTNPPALWDQVSDTAKWQIFLVIAFLEFWSELSTDSHKHYMAGGKPGDFPDFVVGGENGIPHPVPFNYFDPFKLSAKASEEKKASGLVKEINNGRLAMLGIIGFLSEAKIPGSVPALSSIVQPYDGECMAPFTQNVIGAPFGL